MSAAEKETPNSHEALIAFDLQFLSLFDKLCADCIDKAASCTEQVFLISKGFLDQDAASLLKQFYDLYFGSQNMEQRKESMNQSVDDLFDVVASNMAEGRPLDQGLAEADKHENERLGLAGLQKKLEGLINIDEGIRRKLIPSLSSMQFEDAVRQRLDHICFFWRKAFEEINTGSTVNLKALARELAELTSSPQEAEIAYRVFLGEEAPPVGAQAGAALLF